MATMEWERIRAKLLSCLVCRRPAGRPSVRPNNLLFISPRLHLSVLYKSSASQQLTTWTDGQTRHGGE
jgi:hypothetical protein